MALLVIRLRKIPTLADGLFTSMNELSNVWYVYKMDVVVKINKSMEIQFLKFATLAAAMHFIPTLL